MPSPASIAFLSLLSAPLLPFASALNFTLPQNDPLPFLRKFAIAATANGFRYGPAMAGGPYYPMGTVAAMKIAQDVFNENLELLPETSQATTDSTYAALTSSKFNGLQTLDDYTLLYQKGEFGRTLPNGPAPGILSNYSSDLAFSMERLANAPFSLRAVIPGLIPFAVDDAIATTVAGLTTAQLAAAGQLFYVDHSDQATLDTTKNMYAAACSALFYIDPNSGDFLPLAIKTNVGSNLVYTPQDSEHDWTLAKIMFNVNDFFYHQTWHLAATHEVIQIIWMAAIRTLGQNHPVYALMDRLTYQVFAIQPLAAAKLFATGGAFDQIFPYTGTAAQAYSSNLYYSGAGCILTNYFQNDLSIRGLTDLTGKSVFKHFPYFEDASVIYNAQRAFITAFVNSYYASDADILADTEIQAWATEANGAAAVLDFTAAILTRDTLVDVLTHIAHLSSTVHHTVNTNELITVSSTFPMHPAALHQTVPVIKNSTAPLVDFLPNLAGVLTQFQLEGLFARPLLANTGRTLMHMFDNSTFLSGTNSQTRAAASTFLSTMQAFSAQVKARTFDSDGLSQGMPFVWQALDPAVAPYSVSI